jgi:RNA polymerase sigma-70 factor (ECF subfamily)
VAQQRSDLVKALMSSTQSDDDLIQLLANCALRDRKAFARLYSSTSAKLFGVILRILKQEAIAEEALQEVYLKIWDKAGEYHAGKGRPMTWLISIARYRAIDVARSRTRRELPGSESDVDELASEQLGPQQEFERISLGQDLQNCLEQLPESRRDCVLMAYCEGYTHDELSKRMNSPIGTIKSWIRRSLTAIQECLEGLHD